MKITKYELPGWYIAEARVYGKLFIGSGQTHSEAMERVFEKLQWAEIGNWTK